MTTRHSRLLILGSGPAGWTAAVYAARANLKPLLVTGMQMGGQLMTTTEVDNWPGDAHGLMGPDLMARMQAHAERFDTEVVFDHIHTADLSRRPFTLSGDNATYTCDALIIATGATAKYLGIPSEDAFKGRGVSACATCDGFFYKDQDVVVVGGGNTAVEEALYLTNFASKVTVVHRRDEFRASKVMADRVLANPKIKVAWNSVVEEILGVEQRAVRGIRLRNKITGEISDVAVSGVFVAIGHAPSTAWANGLLDLDEEGYIKSANALTNVPGIFVAGDVQDRINKQAVTAAASGCAAALAAERYVDTVVE